MVNLGKPMKDSQEGIKWGREKLDCCVIGDAMIDILFPLSDTEDLNYILHGGVISTKSTISVGGVANVATNLTQIML